MSLISIAVDCGHLAAPMSGSSSGDSTVFPNSVLFNCDPGFILNGSSARTCQANGTWSGLPTLCVGRSFKKLRLIKQNLTCAPSNPYFSTRISHKLAFYKDKTSINNNDNNIIIIIIIIKLFKDTSYKYWKNII